METYEKKYKEALERAKEIIECSKNPGSKEVRMVLSFFPELAESEDERVCGKLIAFLKQCKAVYGDGFKQFGLDIEDAIAWLEKQGEHAKFRDSIQIGDKVTRNQDGVLVNLSQLNRVAKKQGEQKSNPCDGCINRKGCINCENGELRETEQKPAEWRITDEDMFRTAVWHIKNSISNGKPDTITKSDILDWFGTLKDRVQLQPKQEWSEEDIRKIKLICTYLNAYKAYQTPVGTEYIDGCISWAKTLVERVGCEVNCTTTKDWSEEDEERYESCLQKLGTGNPEQPETINSKWFKEHVYSKPQRKPSEEQMKALGVATNISNVPEKEYLELEKLYQDLNKLMKE